MARRKKKPETRNARRRAETELMNQDEVDDGDEEVRVKWLSHYSSVQQILLVGEGDFSFSLSLANAFGSAANIVATSLDSYDELLLKYRQAESNLKKLLEMGATILHVVDATRMKLYTDLNTRRFDRIVYNFPHAGFRGKEDQMPVINSHRSLVKGFFQNACHMLRPYGEVHVSHKSGDPYRKWNLEELASMFSLVLVECIEFRKEDYPGYCNKRGEGAKCDSSFPLGHCNTYMFRLGDVKKKNSSRLNLDPVNRVSVAAPALLSSHLEGSFTRTDCPPIVYPCAAPILNLEWRREQDLSFYKEALACSTVHLPEQRHPIDAPRVPSMFARYERDDRCYQWLSCRLRTYESAEIVTEASHARRVRELCQSSILRNASIRRMLHWRYLEEDICYANYTTRTG